MMTCRCVRPSKELILLPVHSKESWNSPVGLYPDTGPRHIFSSGMLSAVCYLNGQPFRNTECWNASQAKKMAENICLDSSELSPHMFQTLLLWQKYWLYTEEPAPAAPSALMVQDTSLQLVRAPWRAALSFPHRWRDWTQPTCLSNCFYQTTLLAQHRAATAQKQEGNAFPHLSLMSSCPVKHKEHKGSVRESSRLVWLRKDFLLDTSSIKDTSRV